MESSLKKLYDKYWENTKRGCDASKVVNDCLSYKLNFDSVLDVGTGNGDVIKKFNDNGKSAKGVEYSHLIYDTYLKEKFGSDCVEGDIGKLDFPDNSFDLVFSHWVLEHLPEWKVGSAIRETYRVSKKYFYGVIDYHYEILNGELDLGGTYHLTVKPQEWWDGIFRWAGWKPILVNNGLHIYEK